MRKGLRVAIVLASAFGTAWLSTEAAHTATFDLPDYDSARYCRAVGVIGMTYSGATWNGCNALEKQARVKLTPLWAAVGDDIVNLCHRTATFSGPGSYAVLAGCIEQLQLEQ